MPAHRAVSSPVIINHKFPPFYACYLLKSAQTPDSTTIYIGSTPSPPRRIRQHNGEIAAGARKTASKRPWVMQMLVHGFSSRLAALQFEWAWQHPHRSRHLRNGGTNIFGNRAVRILSKNIFIVRTMLALHPFNTWPLHVKLFTEEAVKHWNASSSVQKKYPLPTGFTCTTELEGVDGKSNIEGSGRQGPIDVTDDAFTSEHLSKNTSLISSGQPLACSICHEPIQNYTSDPLSTALCTASKCVAVSHLRCLSNAFHEQATPGSAPKTMIPRGGHCASCGQYTLWGDIIRGSFRRARPSELPDMDPDELYLSDEDNVELLMLPEKGPSRRKRSRSSKRSTQSEPESTSSRGRRSKKNRDPDAVSVVKDKKGTKRAKGKKTAVLSSDEHARDSELELFVSDSDNQPVEFKKPRGRPRKTPSPTPVNIASIAPTSTKSRVGRPRTNPLLESPLPLLLHLAPAPEKSSKRGPGRPPKVNTQITGAQSPPGTSAEEHTAITTSVPSSSPKRSPKKNQDPDVISVVNDKKGTKRAKGKKTAVLSSDEHARNSELELFVSDSDDQPVEIKKPRGRPRKTPSPTPVNIASIAPTSTKSRVGRPRTNPLLESPLPLLLHLAPAPEKSSKRGPGRPPKVNTQITGAQSPPGTSEEEHTAITTSVPSSSPKRGRPRKQPQAPENVVEQPSPAKCKGKAKANVPANEKTPNKQALTKGKGKEKPATPARITSESSSGESFDFDGISERDSDLEFLEYKRPRGRPKKTPVTTPVRKMTTLATAGVPSVDGDSWMDYIHKLPGRSLESAFKALALNSPKPTCTLKPQSRGPGPNDDVIVISD